MKLKSRQLKSRESNSTATRLMVATLACALLAPLAVAQDQPVVIRRVTPAGETITEEIQGPANTVADGQRVEIHSIGMAEGQQNFTFVSSMVNGPTVTGAPYSAEAVTESIQTLADGNRIVNRSSAMIYRDGQGRERREEDGPFHAVFISDPVAEKSYTLHEDTRTAEETGLHVMAFKSAEAFFVGRAQEGAERFGAAHIVTEDIRGPEIGEATGPNVIRQQLSVNATTAFRTAPTTDMKENVEELGTRTMEGVTAEGTRTTVTIPAGSIGNDRDIEIVDERWYSPELQTTVMTLHSDPRTGENTYKLTKISRVEPSPNLFQVPSDYELDEARRAAPRIIQLEPKQLEPRQ